ncbi:MAG: hypothetical protein ACTSRA_15735 [Promethearchaeota archaeon]
MFAYFNLGKTFFMLSKKPESLISRDVIVGASVGPYLDTNLVITHRTRLVSNKVAEVLIILMFLEILVLLILPFHISYYETRFEIHVWSYWIYFYNQLILKLNFDIFMFLFFSFLFFINPVVTAVAIIEEINLYKKYRGNNFIPLKTAFFVHFYLNFVYVLIVGIFGLFIFHFGWAAAHEINIKLKAKRAKQFFESHHDKSNFMDV